MRRFTIYIKNQITIILIMKYSVAWQKTLDYAVYEEVHYLHKESNHYNYFNYEILGGMAKDFGLCCI